MTEFNPEELQKRLNSDSEFRSKFASNPKTAMAEYGVEISNDDSEKLKAASASAAISSDDATPATVVPIPYPIPIK